ncbi:MAG: T9SS type A sorting domain-containing protein [Bacteroidota bacterium]
MRVTLLLFFVLIPAIALAQFSVTGTVPADGSTSVPEQTVLAIAFSSAIDTSIDLEEDDAIFSSVDSVEGMWYSPTLDTLYVDAVLGSNTAHFVYVYGIRSATGQALDSPALVYFTTGASFPPYSISGVVQSGSTGHHPGGAMVVLSPEPISDGPPAMTMGTVADGSGAFTVPYLENGTYYPIAVKDANGDGLIRPEEDDPIAIGDSVAVAGANVSGIVLEFMSFSAVSMSDAWAEAAPVADAQLPSDKVLRLTTSYDADTTGHAWGWEFLYTSESASRGWVVRPSPFGVSVEERDSWDYLWMTEYKPMPSPDGAAASSIFVANAEAAGGAAFRATVPDSLDFYIQVVLGDAARHGYDKMTPDPNLFYWGAEYVYGYQPYPDTFVVMGSKMFLGSFGTGEILGVTDVADDAGVPGEIQLWQNYPNPFNPTTSIQFSLPTRSLVTVEVVDVLGRVVATLADDEFAAGLHQMRWDARTASGIYFARLSAAPVDRPEARTVKVRKMMLMH